MLPNGYLKRTARVAPLRVKWQQIWSKVTKGRPLSDKESGRILGQYRRVLSVTFVRSQAACLVARVGHLGQAARECIRRRRVAMAEGAAAYHAANIRGRGR